jgi:hypothetical protein
MSVFLPFCSPQTVLSSNPHKPLFSPSSLPYWYSHALSGTRCNGRSVRGARHGGHWAARCMLVPATGRLFCMALGCRSRWTPPPALHNAPRSPPGRLFLLLNSHGTWIAALARGLEPGTWCAHGKPGRSRAIKVENRAALSQLQYLDSHLHHPTPPHLHSASSSLALCAIP